MTTSVSVIGGANVDLSATLHQAFIAADSNPGHIDLGYGGVARNIAHNLALCDVPTRLMTIFGGDLLGNLLYDYCRSQGIDVRFSERKEGVRTGMYLNINNHGGEMIAAVADTEAVQLITPEWLNDRLSEINRSKAVVADTNLSEETLAWLMEQVTVPIFIDGVSTTKAHRIIRVLHNSKHPHLHTLKLNLKEALCVTDCTTAEQAAEQLTAWGVAHVYITLGSKGVLCRHDQETHLLAALPIDQIVNSTGAGDAFLAGVVYAHLQGVGFPDTTRYGLQFARSALLSPHAVNTECKSIIAQL